MTGPDSNFVSLQSQCSLREILRSEGNKINCFPRGQGLICYIAGNFEAGNSLIHAVTAVVDGPHSRVTLHSEVIDFATLPLRDFAGKQFHC